METNQPTASPTYAPQAAAPGMFGTKIPSSVAFIVGILLFLLPFSEIKCGGTALISQTGKGFILNEKWKPAKGGNMFGNESMGNMSSKTTGDKAGNSQLFAIGAAGLALLGLLLSFGNARTGGMGGVVTGVLSAGALVGLMVDLKKWFNDSMAKEALNKTQEGADNFGLDKLGNTMGDIKPTLSFTPWFYIAIVAFIAAAIFSYMRMRSSKT